MSPSQLDFLKHIANECEFIIKVTKGKEFEEIFFDEILSKAIIRSLEIIGEAVKRVDDEIKFRYPLVQWRDMAKMRDRLIHHYFGIDYKIVYDSIINDIPELLNDLIHIIHFEEPGNFET